MRRMAGAARPASAAVFRRRRVGDSTTLRDALIRVLPGKASPVRAMLGTWRFCDNPDGSRRASESLRPPVACRHLCERSDCPRRAGWVERSKRPMFPGRSVSLRSMRRDRFRSSSTIPSDAHSTVAGSEWGEGTSVCLPVFSCYSQGMTATEYNYELMYLRLPQTLGNQP